MQRSNSHRVAINDNLRDSILSPYSDIFSPQELFSFKRFKHFISFEPLRFNVTERNHGIVLFPQIEMLSQALTQTSNHTSTYLLATRGGPTRHSVRCVTFSSSIEGYPASQEKEEASQG